MECEKITNMITILRLIDKFLMYPSDNRIEVY